MCVPCEDKCNGCNGAADKCVKCADGYKELYESSSSTSFSDCVKECPGNSYSEDNKCYSCLSGCDKCSDGNFCDICATGQQFMVKDDNGKTTQCLSGCLDQYTHEEGSQVCIKCVEKCNNCNGATDKCVKCASGYKELHDSSSSASFSDCVKECPEHHYSEDNKCYPCMNGCDKCSDGNTCETCSPEQPFMVKDDNGKTTQCLSGCLDQYTHEEGSQVCIKCDEKCDGCNGAADECVKCASTHLPLYDSEETKILQDCMTGCVDGQYKTDDACYPCDSSCKTCASIETCDTCKNTNEFINKEGKCEACDVKCATCSRISTTCLTCASGYKTIHDETSGTIECVDSCYPGFYEDGDECKLCDENCQTCLISATQCTSCAKGKILIENKCNDCNEKCAECEESVEKCKVCADGYKEVIDHSSVLVDCASKCPDGTYEDGNTCRPCDVSCQTCENADTCKTCQGGHFVGSSGKCEVCEDKCEECSGSADKCTSCKSSFKPLYEQEGSSIISDCVENCGDKQYAKGDACYRCDESCKTCTGSEACETCEDQQFINSGGKCEACDPKCASCSVTATACTLCAAGFKPVYDENSAITDCVASCPDGTYDDGEACRPCDSKCKTCNSEASKCTVCADGFKIVYSDSGATVIGNCIEEAEACPDGTFESEGETLSCIPCTPHHNCLLCTDAASCSACGTGEFSIPVYSSEDTPVFVCASSCDGYFTTEETPRCIGCNPALNCAVCHEHNSCESCPFGYFLDSASKCVICDATRNCATCNNSHSCSSCNDGSMKYFSDENERNEVNFEKCVTGDSCPDRSYVFEVDGVSICIHTPASCVDNNCTTCKKGFKGGKCGESCEQYEFCPEGSSASSRGNCSEECYGCNNDDAANGRSQCISCQENHALVDGKCVPCGKNEKSELGNTSDKCEKDGLATWEIAVIAAAAVVGVALVVGAGVGVSHCVSKAPANDLLFDDNGVPLKPLSKKSVQSGEAPADAFI